MEGLVEETVTEETNKPLLSLSDLHAKFGWEEYLVLAATLTIFALIGVFWAWRSRKVKGQFDGNFIIFQLY